MSASIPTKILSISPQFLVTDLNRSIAFYTKNLGFETAFRFEDFYCGIIKDGFSIHLKLANPVVAERENRRNNEHADIIVSVESIDTLYAEVNNKPVTILQPLREMPYGKEFYITDPDEYVIAFLQERK